MPDQFEKKIDKHYTYFCKQDIGTDFKRNIGWFVACNEHEPGKTPSERAYNIARGLSEYEANEMVRKLQAEEMNRRAEIEAKYPDIKQIADAAKLQAAVAKLAALKTKRMEVEAQLKDIDKAIAHNEDIVKRSDDMR